MFELTYNYGRCVASGAVPAAAMDLPSCFHGARPMHCIMQVAVVRGLRQGSCPPWWRLFAPW